MHDTIVDDLPGRTTAKQVPITNTFEKMLYMVHSKHQAFDEGLAKGRSCPVLAVLFVNDFPKAIKIKFITYVYVDNSILLLEDRLVEFIWLKTS